MEEYPQYIAEDNAMAFLSDNGGDTYNLCHCESFRFYVYIHVTQYPHSLEQL